MTRKNFWLSLAGVAIARAQVGTPIAWHAGAALNNQCPVCGTMADPYVIENAGHLIPCSHPKPGQLCVAPVPGERPRSRTVRCQRCNVRFDQDGV